MQTTVTISTSVELFVDAGSLVATCSGIAKGFEWVEAALSPDGKRAISNWLVNLPPETAADNWFSAFSDIVDRIFSQKALSLKFFFRSCLASLIAFVIVVAVYARMHPSSFDDFGHVAFALCIFAVANLLPDYLSLLISRAIVRVMAKRPTATRVLGLLLLDFVLKVILATCVIYIGFSAVFASFQDEHAWAAAWASLRSFYSSFPPFRSAGGLPIGGILFYSSFFTSIWIWFYVLGGVLVKTLTKTGRVWHWLAPFLDLQINPLKSIGRVIGATSFVIGGLFVVLIHA